jgi:uncharacterized protein YjiS (DUF1127 family)
MIAIFLSGAAAEAWKSGTFGAAIRGWILRLVKEWHYRSEVHKLEGMSDRQLRDIGLGRSQIEDAVRGERRAKGVPAGKLGTLLHP